MKLIQNRLPTALLLAPLAALEAVEPTAQQNSAASQWSYANVLAKQVLAKFPFSFRLTFSSE